MSRDSPSRQISDICLKRFPSRVAQAVALRGIRSGAEAAARCGLGESSMSLLMSGKRSPSGESVSRIACGLGVSADWLLGFDVAVDGTPVPGGKVVPSRFWGPARTQGASLCDRKGADAGREEP